ncbi:thiolase family protein [Rhodococcus sp. 1R11]|uniref:thiolase family protein n=1 Tax=Rhodococcus sp. 1R11 TaxID=2559614 RepID=UPI001072D00E|nr:thiolase family protein [Rhodococcus sp. 1R11]TFI44839.1 thiolase family protein [Rhodococcus sp. 1R11]
MARRVWIVGVGMTPFGIHRDKTNYELARWAVRDALADAGPEIGPQTIDVAFFASTTNSILHDQGMISGEIALREMGIQRIPIHNVENACATGSSAVNLAVTFIRAGDADVALAVGTEKMHIGDAPRTMALFDSGYDKSKPHLLDETLLQLGGEVDDSDVGTRSIFMDIYAAMARQHMRLYGTTAAQIAAVSAKNHAHAIDNVRAHYRKAMSVEQVLAARKLSYPLTVPMCAPVTDGAAAVIVCSDEGLRRLGSERPVEVLASVIGTGTDRDTTTFDGHISQVVSAEAYERAGLAPSDIDVAEVHDATAFAEVLQTEMLGLVPPGEGGAAAERGDTTLGGRIPVNTSGGLESKGHPIGASGLGQIFELTEQLRGESGSRQVPGARVALAENGGGFHRGEEAVTSIIILGGR